MMAMMIVTKWFSGRIATRAAVPQWYHPAPVNSPGTIRELPTTKHLGI